MDWIDDESRKRAKYCTEYDRPIVDDLAQYLDRNLVTRVGRVRAVDAQSTLYEMQRLEDQTIVDADVPWYNIISYLPE